MQKKISKKKLYNGICSPATATRIEQGSRRPDYLTLQAIMDRLDISMRLFCSYLSAEEIAYMNWRRNIIITTSVEDDSNLERLVGEEPECDSFNAILREQYHYFVIGVNCCRRNDLREACNCFVRSLRCTNEDIAADNFDGTMVGSFELFLYLLVLQIHIFQGDNVDERLEKVLSHIMKRMDCNKNMGNLLMLAFCVASDCNLGTMGDVVEQRVIEWLKRKKTLYHALDVFRRINQNCYYDVVSALELLYRKQGLSTNYRFWSPCWQDSGMEYQQEYIKGGRLAAGKTQFEISDGIMEVENYSRIEMGKVKPKWVNYKAITCRIGLDDRYIIMDIETSDIEKVKLAKRIVENVNENNLKNAAEELDLFADIVEDREINRRFYEAYKYVIRRRLIKDKILLETILGEVREEFERTISWKLIGKKIYKYSMPDIVFINTIAAIMEQQEKYAEAREFLEKVYTDFGVPVAEDTHILEHIGVLLNLCRARSDVEDYQAAYEMSSAILNAIVKLKEPFFLANVLLEHIYNIVRGGGQEDVAEYANILLPIASFYEDKTVLSYFTQMLPIEGMLSV